MQQIFRIWSALESTLVLEGVGQKVWYLQAQMQSLVLPRKLLPKAMKLGIKKFGIHMMTWSNVLESAYFPQITEVLLDIAGRIAKAVGIEFEFVNIGGGFGVPYKPSDRPLPIDKIAKDIIRVFTEKVEQYKLGEPALCIEQALPAY